MSLLLQRVVRDIEAGNWKPFYLVVGDEPYQAGVILDALKKHLLTDPSSRDFNYESWDGESLDAKALFLSLETVPGLFDVAGAKRFICCSHFEKLSDSALSDMEPYFRNPCESTCFAIFCSKVDKRRGWYKQVSEKGVVVEVSEPYDRDWPRWHGYFDELLKKRIEEDAWEILVASSNRSLSMLWSELGKLDSYVGSQDTISLKNVMDSVAVSEGTDVFKFVDDVLFGRALAAMKGYHELMRSGENEIKMLSLLVRQVRLVEQCKRLLDSGVSQAQAIGAKIGVHPFFVSRVIQQAGQHSYGDLNRAIIRLSDCDFKLKLSEGSLFHHFLLLHFGR